MMFYGIFTYCNKNRFKYSNTKFTIFPKKNGFIHISHILTESCKYFHEI